MAIQLCRLQIITPAGSRILLAYVSMMMAPRYYTFTGRVGEVIPRHVTHVLIAKALKFVPRRAFKEHPNIEEVICHDGVVKIEEAAFSRCPRLRRVIMPGVKEVENYAFNECESLTHIECGKLERIRAGVFRCCESLRSIDLPSIKIVERFVFHGCADLTSVNFGKVLVSIRGLAFQFCRSLERVTLPLKDGILTTDDDDTFKGCGNLNHVDLVEGEVLHETVAALLNEEWRNDVNEEIVSINRILPSTPAGTDDYYLDNGEKSQAIQTWIASVLQKIIRYKAEHRSYLNVAATTLQSSLPNDIVHKNILPFLELPSYTFQGETSD